MIGVKNGVCELNAAMCASLNKRDSQWLPMGLHGLVGWFSSSAPCSVSQSKNRRDMAFTCVCTILPTLDTTSAHTVLCDIHRLCRKLALGVTIFMTHDEGVSHWQLSWPRSAKYSIVSGHTNNTAVKIHARR